MTVGMLHTTSLLRIPNSRLELNFGRVLCREGLDDPKININSDLKR